MLQHRGVFFGGIGISCILAETKLNKMKTPRFATIKKPIPTWKRYFCSLQRQFEYKLKKLVKLTEK